MTITRFTDTDPRDPHGWAEEVIDTKLTIRKTCICSEHNLRERSQPFGPITLPQPNQTWTLPAGAGVRYVLECHNCRTPSCYCPKIENDDVEWSGNTHSRRDGSTQWRDRKKLKVNLGEWQEMVMDSAIRSLPLCRKKP